MIRCKVYYLLFVLYLYCKLCPEVLSRGVNGVSRIWLGGGGGYGPHHGCAGPHPRPSPFTLPLHPVVLSLLEVIFAKNEILTFLNFNISFNTKMSHCHKTPKWHRFQRAPMLVINKFGKIRITVAITRKSYFLL